jgi:hypothetical protein
MEKMLRCAINGVEAVAVVVPPIVLVALRKGSLGILSKSPFPI